MDEMDDFFGNDDLDAEPMADEAIEDNQYDGDGNRRVVEPKLARVKKATNPRLALNENMLTGPKGISALRETFKNFRPEPKSDPYDNLEKMMKNYAYWGHLMFPKMKTEDVLSRVEQLGTRRQVKVYLAKQRMGIDAEEVQKEEVERRKKNQKTSAIIDDGADDDEEDVQKEDVPEENEEEDVVIGKRHVEKEKEKEKTSPEENFDEGEEEALMMEEERRREEQEAREGEEADELMADFDDMNNDW